MKLSSLADILDGPYTEIVNMVMGQLAILSLQGSVDMNWDVPV